MGDLITETKEKLTKSILVKRFFFAETNLPVPTKVSKI